MIARLAEEQVAVRSKPAQQISEEPFNFDVFEIHEQPVGEHQVITDSTQSTFNIAWNPLRSLFNLLF